MNRRTFLAPARAKKEKEPQYEFQRQGAPSSGTNPYTGAWTASEVAHLLRRTMFGAAKADIDYFAGKTMSDAVDELLTASALPPDPPVNNYNNATYTDPNVPLGQTWVNAPFDINVALERAESLRGWWIGLMLNQGRSIEEKMTLFWHNHFSTEVKEYNDARYGYKYLATLRQYSLGNFQQLTKAITVEPAMLHYLNGYLNKKNAPDENYARELQELFTVGKGPDSHYTEDDVKAAARTLTGFRIDATNNTYYFDSSRHDTGDKQFSSFYNNTLISGQSGAAGEQELDDLLDMIFATNEVAMFLCRKLYRFFVYYDIDSTIEANVIQPMADVFRNNNYDIKPVLSLLLKSEHFYDSLNHGCLIKPPVDFMVGFFREFKIVFPDSSNVATQYYMWKSIAEYGFVLQEFVLDPPNVAGWPAYYQVPSFHEIWINSVTLPGRNAITDLMVYAGVTKAGQTIIVDCFEFAKQYSDPSNPDTLIDDMINHLHTQPASITLKLTLKFYLLSGQTQNYYWTNVWMDYINNPTDTQKQQTVKIRLLPVIQYVLDLAEYQLS